MRDYYNQMKWRKNETDIAVSQMNVVTIAQKLLLRLVVTIAKAYKKIHEFFLRGPSGELTIRLSRLKPTGPCLTEARKNLNKKNFNACFFR